MGLKDIANTGFKVITVDIVVSLNIIITAP